MIILTGIMALVSSAISSLSAALPAIGMALKAFVAKIPGPILEKSLEKLLRLVGEVVSQIFQMGTPCDELGYKARVAEKKEADFATTEAYVKYLNTEVPFDKGAFERLSPSEKMECALHGMILYAKAIVEKIGIAVSPLFWIMNAALGIQPSVVVQTLLDLKQAGVSTDDYCAYFKGNCEPEKAQTVDLVVKKLFQTKENPSAILDMQEKVRELGI